MNTLARLWDRLRTNFWFVPMSIVAASIALAIGLVTVHSEEGARWLARWPQLFGSGPEGARQLLSTIAGSMMTVVGVTFSMTLVTLALASGQYSSRILRNFMRDQITQVVLGIFAGIFVYCLTVMRTIRGGEETVFVPGLAVSLSIVLATGGIVVLIYFIHHVASSIQASSIVASVAEETLETVDRLYPAIPEGETASDDAGLVAPESTWQPVAASRSGYIEYINVPALARLAIEHESVVRMEVAVGGFVVRDLPLVSLANEEPPSAELAAALRATIRIARHRTLRQECAFGIRQIVDVALRALSPSTNDTTTAIMCVDYLAAILTRLARRSFSSWIRDKQGRLRVITRAETFATLAGSAFDQIRGGATGNVAVLLRMLGALQTIASATDSADRRQTLGQHVQAIAELAARTIESPRDKARFDLRHAQVRDSIESDSRRASL